MRSDGSKKRGRTIYLCNVNKDLHSFIIKPRLLWLTHLHVAPSALGHVPMIRDLTGCCVTVPAPLFPNTML